MDRKIKYLYSIALVSAFSLTACTNVNTENQKKNKQMTLHVDERKIEENKQLIRLWLEEGWNNNKNQEIVGQIFSAEWITTSSALDKQPKGIEGAMFWVTEFKKMFSETHFTITHLIADTNFVTVRFEVTVVHTGSFMGIPPTNKRIKYSGIAIHEVKDGKLVRTWTEFDLYGLKAQLESK